MLNETVANRYRGKMVRVYTRDDQVVQGFLMGGEHGAVQVFCTREGHQLTMKQVPLDQVRMIMNSGLIEEKGRVCRYLYGSVN